MISKKMADSINQQINRELYSAYLYLSMAAYVKSINLNGFTNWFKVQAQEEVTHAMRFFSYLNDQGQNVVLKDIEQPPKDFSVDSIFEETLEHEKKVTKMINGLVDLAKKENDHATEVALQWFVTEQIEEEANATEIMQKIKLVGKHNPALLMMDAELGKREFSAPK